MSDSGSYCISIQDSSKVTTSKVYLIYISVMCPPIHGRGRILNKEIIIHSLNLPGIPPTACLLHPPTVKEGKTGTQK